MIRKDPEVVRYEQLFHAIGTALLDINATPPEALMSIAIFSDMLTAISVNNPEWFMKSNLKELLGIKWEDKK